MSQHIDPEVKQSFIVDNLTTNDAGKALSAAQGKKIFDRLGVSNSPASDTSISSFDDLKTYLNNVASSITEGNVIALIWYNNFTNENFSQKTYLCGYLYKITNVFFTVNVVGVNGKHFTISRSNNTWYVDHISDEIITLNSNIATLNSYGKTYHIGWLVSTSTLAQQIQNEFQNHKSESGFRLTFNITSSQAPSDLPSTGQEWKYGCGEVKVRSCDGNGIADGMVILYAFSVNKIALRSFSNSNFNANWAVLGA